MAGVKEGDGFSVAPSLDAGAHYHEEQEELYFVHRGSMAMTFGGGDEQVLEEGGIVRVSPSTVRKVRNLSDSDDLVYLVIGGKDGYVGRDGHQPEGETKR